MLACIVLTVISYFLIVYVCITMRSVVAVLEVEKDGKVVGEIPFYARHFSRGVCMARKELGYSLLEFSENCELTLFEVFALEHGYKVSSKSLIHFCDILGMIVFDANSGRYVISDSSSVMEWCISGIRYVVLNELNLSKNSIITYKSTLPEVSTNDPIHDEYVFKKHPILYFRSEIISIDVCDMDSIDSHDMTTND